MGTESLISSPEPAWTKSLLDSLKIKEHTPTREIFDRADRFAQHLAPNTRRLWRLILFTEGLAVILPLCWLMVAHRAWPPGLIAVSVALTTTAVVGFCWWLRWRHQQHNWTRSRLLAEIARSSLATSDWSDSITRSALEGAPTLQPLAQLVTSSQNVRKETNLADLKENYIRNRIDDQLRFFENKAKAAALDRQRLSRYVTRSLDGALCLAVLGLWLGFSERCRWLLSVANSDLVLALAGACLPLIAILMQSLSSYLELNRRAGRYAQQWEYLAKARNDLLAASNFSEATSIVHTTERVLLSEIIEWFYQAEHAEVFYRSAGAPVNLTPREQLTSVPEGRWTLWLTRMLDGMGMALNVTGRLIFGRVILIALTSVLTSLLIFSRAPQDIVQRTLLRTADGQLLSHTALSASGILNQKRQSEASFSSLMDYMIQPFKQSQPPLSDQIPTYTG